MENPDLLTYSASTVAYLLGLVVPLLVALVTKATASSGLKGVLNAALSAVAGAATYLVSIDGGYDWRGFVNAFVNVFLVSIVSYYGVWKATGVSDTLNMRTAGFGIGRPPVLETPEKGDPASST